MSDTVFRLGAVGFGGFAQFAIEQFTRTHHVELRGIAASRRQAAFMTARKLSIPPPRTPEDLCGRDDIDLVYIATPPYLHHEQALLALQAGKHVIVEKPLATTLPDADDLIRAAAERDLLLTVNQMQRYNPLAEAIRHIVHTQLLGQLLYACFENDASDQGLPPEHWFWNRAQSGGIFVEHGVHFFDLFASWLGEGRVLAAQRSIRPTTGVEEQVHCTVRYGRTALVSFYHGFHQSAAMDRQQLRMVFERGDITLHGWIPRFGQVHALVSPDQADQLLHGLPDARVVARQPLDDPALQARHQAIAADQILDATFTVSDSAQSLYTQCLQGFLVDQLAWIVDRNHTRKLTAQHGRDALALADAATKLANAEQ